MRKLEALLEWNRNDGQNRTYEEKMASKPKKDLENDYVERSQRWLDLWHKNPLMWHTDKQIGTHKDFFRSARQV